MIAAHADHRDGGVQPAVHLLQASLLSSPRYKCIFIETRNSTDLYGACNILSQIPVPLSHLYIHRIFFALYLSKKKYGNGKRKGGGECERKGKTQQRYGIKRVET
jgi:hypothetical protein